MENPKIGRGSGMFINFHLGPKAPAPTSTNVQSTLVIPLPFYTKPVPPSIRTHELILLEPHTWNEYVSFGVRRRLCLINLTG
jgi:hypothetical protein